MNNQMISYEENDFENDYFSYDNYLYRKERFNPSYQRMISSANIHIKSKEFKHIKTN